MLWILLMIQRMYDYDTVPVAATAATAPPLLVFVRLVLACSWFFRRVVIHSFTAKILINDSSKEKNCCENVKTQNPLIVRFVYLYWLKKQMQTSKKAAIV
jgi:hypothetical protein